MSHSELSVVVLTRQRYQELELWYPLLRFREVGAETTLVGRTTTEHLGGVGYPAIPQVLVEDSAVPSVVIVPGRAPAAAGDDTEHDVDVTDSERALLQAVRDGGGVIAAIGDGVDVLGAAGLLSGRTVAANDLSAGRLAGYGATRSSETVHTEAGIVTAASADDLPDFVNAIDAAALVSA